MLVGRSVQDRRLPHHGIGPLSNRNSSSAVRDRAIANLVKGSGSRMRSSGRTALPEIPARMLDS